MRDTSRQARESSPENKEGNTFIIKEKAAGMGGEGHLLPHSWADVKAYIINSSFGPIWLNQDHHGAI